jgi:uncharacterized membrane protein YgdD (TMEM256/DUF423 family)
MAEAERIPFDIKFEKLEAEEMVVPSMFGILFALLTFILTGWKPVIEACVAMGVFGAIMTLCSSRTLHHDNPFTLVTFYAVFSFIIYLFVLLEQTIHPIIFWIIVSIAGIVLVFGILIFMGFITLREKPDNK